MYFSLTSAHLLLVERTEKNEFERYAGVSVWNITHRIQRCGRRALALVGGCPVCGRFVRFH